MKINYILIVMISFFSSCKGQYRDVPDWADFFNRQDYNCYIDVVEDYFKAKDIDISIEDGVIIVNNDHLELNNLGLLNLAQICNQAEKTNWKEIVTDHFDRMIEANRFEIEFDNKIRDFEAVKKYIGVRLYHKDYIEQIGKENVVCRNITDEILTLLVFDLPHTVNSIGIEKRSIWDKQDDELFEIGFQNIKTNYPLDISQQDMKDFKIWFVQSDHVFASNILLDKEELGKYIGPKGALIGIPHRHAVIIYPIENLEVVKAVNSLIFVISGMYTEGPGSISDKLYWYNNEKMLDLPYRIEDDKLQFYPPEKFVKMLNKLKN